MLLRHIGKALARDSVAILRARFQGVHRGTRASAPASDEADVQDILPAEPRPEDGGRRSDDRRDRGGEAERAETRSVLFAEVEGEGKYDEQLWEATAQEARKVGGWQRQCLKLGGGERGATQ